MHSTFDTDLKGSILMLGIRHSGKGRSFLYMGDGFLLHISLKVLQPSINIAPALLWCNTVIRHTDWSHSAWVLIPASLFTKGMALGKVPNQSVPVSSAVKWGNASSIGLL